MVAPALEPWTGSGSLGDRQDSARGSPGLHAFGQRAPDLELRP